jgi:hypothetical protein
MFSICLVFSFIFNQDYSRKTIEVLSDLLTVTNVFLASRNAVRFLRKFADE